MMFPICWLHQQSWAQAHLAFCNTESTSRDYKHLLQRSSGVKLLFNNLLLLKLCLDCLLLQHFRVYPSAANLGYCYINQTKYSHFWNTIEKSKVFYWLVCFIPLLYCKCLTRQSSNQLVWSTGDQPLFQFQILYCSEGWQHWNHYYQVSTQLRSLGAKFLYLEIGFY